LYESANAHIVTSKISKKNFISEIQKIIDLTKKPVASKILKKYKNLIHKQRVVMLIITALIYLLSSDI
jgi:cytochrome c-type biogenesis protein CcmH/NrfG